MLMSMCVLAMMFDVSPPEPRIAPVVTVEHGITRVDPYHWMRDRGSEEVISHLNAENAYAESMTADLQPIRDTLYEEYLGRLVEDDEEVPWLGEDGWTYWSRTEKGKDYPITMRRRGDIEQVVIDENELGDGFDYYSVTNWAVSPDGKVLAWLEDTTGYEHATLKLKDIASGKMIDQPIPEVGAFSLAWLNNTTLFYTRYDESSRPDSVHRHVLGTSPTQDVEVAREDDGLYWVGVDRLRDGAGVVIPIGSTLTTEVLFIPSNGDSNEAVPILPRVHGVEYGVDHRSGEFLVRINDTGSNFRLVAVRDDALGLIDRELIAHDPKVYITGVTSFRDGSVISTRRDGYTALEVLDHESGSRNAIKTPAQVSTIMVGSGNEVFDAPAVRIMYMSPLTPTMTVDVNLDDLKWDIRKQREVPGWDPARYAVTRVVVPARDGTGIPVSITHLADLDMSERHPMLLYGYGAYGSSMNPYFSTTRPSMVDRGVLFAVAHVRGGGEMGREWYIDGKFHAKPNTFTDFIDVAEGLVEAGWADPNRIAIEGGSAGGLLIGAVLNMRPDLWCAAHAAVPFVDVVNTMMDPTIPLTVGEYEEWGNPNDEAYYKTMLSYSPYDNVGPKAYPPLLVTAGLNDPRVQYWEPTKWVSKLRDQNTSSHPILQRTNMGAGHGGASGRYGRYREIAWEEAFILHHLLQDEHPSG